MSSYHTNILPFGTTCAKTDNCVCKLLIDLRRQAKLLPPINLTPYLCIQYHGKGALSLNNLGDDTVLNSKYYV